MAMQTIGQTTLTDLLREDHRRMKDLFRSFETAETEERKELVRDALKLIQTHDLMEKKLLYPNALRTPGVSRAVALRCEEAHHVANVLVAELRVMPYTDRFFAKFERLSTLIRAHIEEEEKELFPSIEGSTLDLVALGRRMEELRERLPWSAATPTTLGGGVGAVAATALLVGVGWAVYKLVTD